MPEESLPLVMMLALLTASTVRAADESIVESTAESTAGAGLAFARYIAALEQASPWNLETVEIDASLPKLEKRGRLRAIRRFLPFGKPEYQVLRVEGDRTVRQQVIARYLTADAQGKTPSVSVDCFNNGRS